MRVGWRPAPAIGWNFDRLIILNIEEASRVPRTFILEDSIEHVRCSPRTLLEIYILAKLMTVLLEVKSIYIAKQKVRSLVSQFEELAIFKELGYKLFVEITHDVDSSKSTRNLLTHPDAI